MFTGIIEEIGTVKAIEKEKNLFVLKIRADKVLKGTKEGDSISVNGVCLTVTAIRQRIVFFDVMQETLNGTTLNALEESSPVNLERAMRMSSRVGGHFVTGHVDAVTSIQKITEGKNYTEIRLSLPRALAKYIALKGSVCLDGVSLTIGYVKKTIFCVHLIPFTKKVTTFGLKKKGDTMNIEIDILARYVLNGGNRG